MAGAKNPVMANAFLLLAEIIFGKSDQSDLGLVEKNNKILEATALGYYVLNLCKLRASTSSEDFSELERKAKERIKSLQDGLFLSMDIDVVEGHKVFDKVKKHQAYLQEIRNSLREGLQSMPSISHDDLNSEYEHYQKIQELYKVVAESLLKLVSEMLDDCVSLLGQSPCHYAAIALGSLARLEATPFSDFEWAILVEKSDEEHKIYFRKLTQLLHSMVISFGETILPSMGIDCLGKWFHDDVTPRGFAFDGALPQACKTPLGKREKDGTIVYELIDTPKQISEFQNMVWIRENPQLAGVLRTVLLINRGENPAKGNEVATAAQLVRDYKLCLNEQLDEIIYAEKDVWPEGRKKRECVALIELARASHEFNPRLSQHDKAGRFFEIKKEIYRIMDRLMASVGLYFNACAQSAWECLLWLHQGNFLSEKGMRNLFVAVSIGAELRARAYTERGRQDDYLDCQELGVQKDLSHLKTLRRYYFTVLPFFSYIRESVSPCPETSLDQMSDEDFYSDLYVYRGAVSMRLRQYKRAKIELQKHLRAYPDDMSCVRYLGCLLSIKENCPQATLWYSKELHHMLCCGDYLYNGEQLRSLNQIKSWREFVQPLKSSMNDTVLFDNLRVLLHNLGLGYYHMQQHLKAIDCLESCVELYSEASDLHPCNKHGLARSLSTLGYCCQENDDDKALECFEKALGIFKNTGSFETSVAEASVKLSLGEWHHRHKQFDHAKTYLEEAVNQFSYAYGTNDGDGTRLAKFCLGEVYLRLLYYDKAVKILSSCLQSLVKPLEEPSWIKPRLVEPLLKVALTGSMFQRPGLFGVSDIDLCKVLDDFQNIENNSHLAKVMTVWLDLACN